MPTTLPPNHEQNNPDLTGLGADAWAGLAVVVAMFIVGVLYWTGPTHDANAADGHVFQTSHHSSALTRESQEH